MTVASADEAQSGRGVSASALRNPLNIREDGQRLHRQFNPEAPRCERGEVRRVQAEERPADTHLYRPESPRVLPRAHEPGKHVLPRPVAWLTLKTAFHDAGRPVETEQKC